MRKKLFILLLFILCGGLIYIIVYNKNMIRKREYSLYMEFLRGNRAVNGMMISDIIIPTGEPEKQYFSEYTFWDSDGDNFNELHIRSERYYYVIDCVNDELCVWKELHPRTELLNNGDYLYIHIGEAPPHYDYQYFVTNQEGEDVWSISYSWYDENNNGAFEKNDLYLMEGTQVLSYEEWEEVQKNYLNVGTDKISWIRLTDKKEWKQMTKREALDTLFDYLCEGGERPEEVTLFEEKVIGYKWTIESASWNTYLCEKCFSENGKYLIFELYNVLYDSNGEFIRTEILNDYAVDIHNGEVIPRKIDKEDGTWEHNEDYDKVLN